MYVRELGSLAVSTAAVKPAWVMTLVSSASNGSDS